MTDEELKALMRATRTEGYPEDLRPLVEAVQALEREACAQLCEHLANFVSNEHRTAIEQRQFCAKAIRARGMK